MTRLTMVFALLITVFATAGCTSEPELDPVTDEAAAPTCVWTIKELLHLWVDQDSASNGYETFTVPVNMTHLNITESNGEYGVGDYQVVITDPTGASFDTSDSIEVFHHGTDSRQTISLRDPLAGEWSVEWQRPPVLDHYEMVTYSSSCVESVDAVA